MREKVFKKMKFVFILLLQSLAILAVDERVYEPDFLKRYTRKCEASHWRFYLVEKAVGVISEQVEQTFRSTQKNFYFVTHKIFHVHDMKKFLFINKVASFGRLSF